MTTPTDDYRRGYERAKADAMAAMRGHFGPRNTDAKGSIGWGVTEAIRALRPAEPAACPESGTAHRTESGWHDGVETCGTCGKEVRIRDNGMVAKHRPPASRKAP